ncbi:unnamed protein product [Meloidogyne enterolobii]|uniref:Uncharacterized protein n=1 Tax=Meloidogyne enterolobii TaxID=390850 RepID=A0ACB1AM73_MELEN
MFSIFWLNFFLILFYFLLFNVDCMWNRFKGKKKEKSLLEAPLLSQQNYEEGSSSSGTQSIQHFQPNNGKKILLVTEALYPHYKFSVC